MTKDLPLVAIITPVYNGSPWLERTLACVQRQTYPNIVHVLLDNASTDDTAEVIERFRGQKIPLKVAHNETALNQTANWNAAMKLVPEGTKYAMLLCADDLIRADAIEKLVASAEADDEIVMVTACDIAFDRVRAPVLPGNRAVGEGKDMVRAFIQNTYNHFAWQLFFTRWQAAWANEDFFSYTATTLDTERLLRLLQTGKLAIVKEPLFYTRHHSGNMSAQFTNTRKPNFRLYRWEAAVRYAKALLTAAEARKVMQEEKYFVLRFEMNWRRAGATDAANALKKRLIDDGHQPHWYDYILATLTYPAYKARQARISNAANAAWPQTITEGDFVTWRSNTPLSSAHTSGEPQGTRH